MFEKEIKKLKKKLKASEGSNQILQKNYEEALDDCETCHEQIRNLQNSLERIEPKVMIKTEPNINHKKDEIIKQMKRI